MPDPKGNLVTPVGFTDAGDLLAWLVTNAGVLRVYIEGGTVTLGTHNLLDGDIHPDTVAGSAVEGDIIVGIDQGAGQIKWQRLARGSTGQVLTVQSDGSLAWAAASGGVLVQSVYNAYNSYATGTATIPVDNTIPQNTEGTEFMSAGITPTNAAHSIEVDVILWIASSTTITVSMAIFRDTTADAIAAIDEVVNATNYTIALAMRVRVAAGSISPTTFKVRAGGNGASTLTFNGVAGANYFGAIPKSSITLREYSG